MPATAGAGAAAAAPARGTRLAATAGPQLYADIDTVVAERLTTGIDEFDRVLGGGVVPGIAGADRRRAGHRQVDAAAAGGGALRADTSGRCSTARAKNPSTRSSRAASGSAIERAPLYLLAETCLERILEEIARLRPALVIVDSIQTVFSLKFQSAPGSIGQVREAATQLLFAAKGQNIPTFLVGHVTKDGSLAGPKVARAHRRHGALLRGREAPLASRRPRGEEPLRRGQRAGRVRDDRHGPARRCRIRRRCSSPSVRANAPGSAVLCCMEGSRPLLVEVQALVSTSSYGNARRMASGLDQNRLSLLLAVLEKRAGLNLIGEDVFVNVAGGMTVDEPAADLGVVAAVASSLRNRPIRAGDRGLRRGRPGRRSARHHARRRCACARPRRWASPACVVPARQLSRRDEAPAGCELVTVRNVGEALDELMTFLDGGSRLEALDPIGSQHAASGPCARRGGQAARRPALQLQSAPWQLSERCAGPSVRG